jgi:hypothetical protein
MCPVSEARGLQALARKVCPALSKAETKLKYLVDYTTWLHQSSFQEMFSLIG